VAVVVGAAFAAAACGGDDAPARRDPAPAVTAPATAAAPAAGFPKRPQVSLGPRALRDGREPAPQAAEPATTPAYVIGTVHRPERLDGRAGVFCRGSADGRTGYELTVDRRGRVRLERLDDGRRTLLAGYATRVGAATDPEQALPVILVCGRGDARGVTLGVLVGAGQLTYIRDRRPLDPGARAAVGLVTRGGNARFGALDVRFAG
jgi:hypothetical protein